MAIKIKTIYDEIENSDGKRVFVDGNWPQGLTSERAELDHWMWELAPSPLLREWAKCHCGSKDFRVFKKEYLKELEKDPRKESAITELLWLEHTGNVTLLSSFPDRKKSPAEILKEFLMEKKVVYRSLF